MTCLHDERALSAVQQNWGMVIAMRPMKAKPSMMALISMSAMWTLSCVESHFYDVPVLPISAQHGLELRMAIVAHWSSKYLDLCICRRLGVIDLKRLCFGLMNLVSSDKIEVFWQHATFLWQERMHLQTESNSETSCKAIRTTSVWAASLWTKDLDWLLTMAFTTTSEPRVLPGACGETLQMRLKLSVQLILGSFLRFSPEYQRCDVTHPAA